jgi:flagellar biosynthesis anti-sigma factor FlgM
MTNRIDGNQGTPLPPSTSLGPGQIERVDSGKTPERANKPAVSPAKADRVEVSQDAAFVNTVVQAAHETPAMRDDKIAAAKKALADGTLGQDAAKLADALIDHMLDDKTS